MADDRFPPKGTGESTTTRGEDHAKNSSEEGAVELEDDAAGRPAGGSSARMHTGVDPQDSVNTDRQNG